MYDLAVVSDGCTADDLVLEVDREAVVATRFAPEAQPGSVRTSRLASCGISAGEVGRPVDVDAADVDHRRPGEKQTTFPPDPAAMSTITEPGCI